MKASTCRNLTSGISDTNKPPTPGQGSHILRRQSRITIRGDEEEDKEESTESLVCDEDFEVFYQQDETHDIASSSRLGPVLVSEDQEAIHIPEAMVLEKRMPDLLYLLESHAGGATPEVHIVPKPPTPIPPPPSQTKLVNKK